MPNRSNLLRPWWLLVLLLAVRCGIAADPEATPAPATPAATGPLSDTGRWLAGVDAQWQADFRREVTEPYEKSLAELRRQYLATLDGRIATAKQARREEAAVWQAERERISSDEDVPPADDADVLPALKTVRDNYRAQSARLDKDRFGRARGLYARCDALLTKNQYLLNQRQRVAEAAELDKERDRLRAAWLQPPTPAASAPTAGKTAKIAPQQMIDKLLALGASVWIKRAAGEVVQVKSGADAVGSKYTFSRVEFPAQRGEDKPLVADDYTLLDSLGDLTELVLNGETVDDAVVAKLRAFHALRVLRLDHAKISTATYNIFAALPELHDLELNGTETTDEAMKTVAQCHKLQHLELSGLPISDASLALLPNITTLEELVLNDLDKITTAGFAHFPDCRALRTIFAAGFTIYSGMVEHLGQCKKLDTVALPDSVLKDSDIAPLGALSKLRVLDLNNSAITGAAFAAWPAHVLCTSLNLDSAGGVDDAGFKNIGHVFPKVEDLNVKLAASGFSVAGAADLRRLSSLHNLRLGGPGVTDEVVADVAHCENLVTLGIPGAQLSDKGIAALVHLAHLTELSIDVPPLTEPALKAFGRCKALTTLNIGKTAEPETEGEIHGVLPKLTINRAQ